MRELLRDEARHCRVPAQTIGILHFAWCECVGDYFNPLIFIAISWRIELARHLNSVVTGAAGPSS